MIDMEKIEEHLVAIRQANTFLMAELFVALHQSGVLSNSAIAGILLRAEAKAESEFDNIENINRTSSELEFLRQWSEDRLGLQPQIYTLQKAFETWRRDGMRGPAPLEPAEIASLFD